MDSGLSAPSLNMDVMHIIMSYATRNTVSYLMKTCHTLNSEGAKYLLRDGVFIGCQVQLSSFIHFLMARDKLDDCLRRLLFFDRLTLQFSYHPSPSRDIGVALTEFFEIIVPAAINFTFLDIRNAEALLTAYPPLGAAIAKLTTLRALHLSFTAEHCAALLRTLQSRLVKANIAFGDVGDEREDEDIPEDDRNPILLFHGSQSTLVSLSIHNAVCSLDGPCYTNVTNLQVILADMDLPFIEDYICAFPNLLSLECSGYRDVEPEDWEDRRATSMLYQADHGTWRSLCRFSGSVLVLWMFGLRCRISSIELDFMDDKDMVDAGKLGDVLQDARPLRLVLRLPKASCLLDDDFRSALRVDSLRVFDLRVKFHCYEDSTLRVSILDILVDVVRSSSATNVKVSLDWSWTVEMRHVMAQVREQLPIRPFEVYLQDMDVDAYVDALFASVASLEELQVSILGPKQYRCQAHRVRT